MLTVSVEIANVLSSCGLVLGVKVAHGLQTALARLLHEGALRGQVVVGGTSARETQHAIVGHDRHAVRCDSGLRRGHSVTSWF